MKRPERANKENNIINKSGANMRRDMGEIESSDDKNSSSEVIKALDPGTERHSANCDKAESELHIDSEEV